MIFCRCLINSTATATAAAKLTHSASDADAARRQFGNKNNEITKYAEAYQITVREAPYGPEPPSTSFRVRTH